MIKSTLRTTIEKMRIATHCLLQIQITENGSNFIIKEIEDFLKQNRIHHIRTVPYHPAPNGLAEKTVQTFKEELNMNKVWKHKFRDFWLVIESPLRF